MGPRTRAAFDALIAGLEAGLEDRYRLRRAAIEASDILEKTFDTLVSKLALFGLVVRLGQDHRRLRLTTLGRRWLAEQVRSE